MSSLARHETCLRLTLTAPCPAAALAAPVLARHLEIPLAEAMARLASGPATLCSGLDPERGRKLAMLLSVLGPADRPRPAGIGWRGRSGPFVAAGLRHVAAHAGRRDRAPDGEIAGPSASGRSGECSFGAGRRRSLRPDGWCCAVDPACAARCRRSAGPDGTNRRRAVRPAARRPAATRAGRPDRMPRPWPLRAFGGRCRRYGPGDLPTSRKPFSGAPA